MENLAIVDDVVEQEGFKIDSDSAAEWALTKIREEEAESNRMILVCENMIEYYKAKIEKAKFNAERKTSNLRFMLQEYFNQVDHKVTKTQATYQLPSGKLILKKKDPEFIRNDEELLKYFRVNYPQFVKIKETPDWAGFKKQIEANMDVSTGNYLVVDKNTGELLTSVTVQYREPEFKIEL